MCGIWSDSDDHLTTDPRTFLYSILYSKKAAVEAYTPPTHCPMALYLYSSYTAAIQQLYRLYSYTAIQQLYSIHPLQHPSEQRVSRRIWNEFLPCTVMDVVPRGKTGVTRGHLARTLVLLRCDDVDPPKDRLSTYLVNTLG